MTRSRITVGRINTHRPGQDHMAIDGVKLCPTKGTAAITSPTAPADVTAATACRRCFTPENMAAAGIEITGGPALDLSVDRMLDRVATVLYPRPVDPRFAEIKAYRPTTGPDAATVAQRKAQVAAYLAAIDAPVAA